MYLNLTIVDIVRQDLSIDSKYHYELRVALDRVIAYGHTWSPMLELTPEIPMFHGHSVAIY